MKLFTAMAAVKDMALAKVIAERINGENISRAEIFALLSE